MSAEAEILNRITELAWWPGGHANPVSAACAWSAIRCIGQILGDSMPRATDVGVFAGDIEISWRNGKNFVILFGNRHIGMVDVSAHVGIGKFIMDAKPEQIAELLRELIVGERAIGEEPFVLVGAGIAEEPQAVREPMFGTHIREAVEIVRNWLAAPGMAPKA